MRIESKKTFVRGLIVVLLRLLQLQRRRWLSVPSCLTSQQSALLDFKPCKQELLLRWDSKEIHGREKGFQMRDVADASANTITAHVVREQLYPNPMLSIRFQIFHPWFSHIFSAFVTFEWQRIICETYEASENAGNLGVDLKLEAKLNWLRVVCVESLLYGPVVQTWFDLPFFCDNSIDLSEPRRARLNGESFRLFRPRSGIHSFQLKLKLLHQLR